jgi:hypothetical protein
LYGAARACEIQPGEFWQMTMPETLLEITMRSKSSGQSGLSGAALDTELEWLNSGE